MGSLLSPSPLALVPFVSVAQMMTLVGRVGLDTLLKSLADQIEADFRRWPVFDKMPRVPIHSRDGVIEVMPTSDGSYYSLKYVNGHPANLARGYQTVTAFGLFARVDTGYPLLLSEMTLLTALRTAATSALAARYLASPSAKTMAIIGNGAQCEFQAVAFREIVGVETIHLFDVNPDATAKAMRNLAEVGIDARAFATREEAVARADIITTCTADKRNATILTDNLVGSGQHINAIGGDCPGKTELHRDVLLRAKIFTEFTPQSRIEGEIQQLDDDYPVTELWRLISGDAPGRETERDITVFDSVGFAIEDFAALRVIHDLVGRHPDLAEPLDLIADPDDPRDLYGMLKRALGTAASNGATD
ncbi:MAG: ornithine cyclodeaminase [Pseudomonadota bacterium]